MKSSLQSFVFIGFLLLQLVATLQPNTKLVLPKATLNSPRLA